MSDNIEGEQKKNRNELAKLFDHTYLKAYASYEDMKTLCSHVVLAVGTVLTST